MARRRRSLGDLTQEQMREIAEAPKVAPQWAELTCQPEPPRTLCPAAMSTPPWGDARTSFPSAACQSIGQQASGIEWWKLLLIAVGGVVAIREVLSDG